MVAARKYLSSRADESELNGLCCQVPFYVGDYTHALFLSLERTWRWRKYLAGNVVSVWLFQPKSERAQKEDVENIFFFIFVSNRCTQGRLLTASEIT